MTDKKLEYDNENKEIEENSDANKCVDCIKIKPLINIVVNIGDLNIGTVA